MSLPSDTEKKELKNLRDFGKMLFPIISGKRNRRKELHMSQENLAKKIGKKRPYISRIENGEDIRLSNFALVASALGLSN